MEGVNGLHHVTAIAGPAQENLDFYAGILGMRLVKKSVNQDDPGTYHLFYADAAGHPGTDLTFFPWAHLAPPREGHGLSTEVSLTVPPDSLDFWGQRLQNYGVRVGAIETRFGERVLPLTDTHGLKRRAGREPFRDEPDVYAVGREPDSGRPADPRARRRPHAGARSRADDRVPDERARLLAPAQQTAAGSATACSTARPAATSICRNRPVRGAARGASAASITWPGGSTTRSTRSGSGSGLIRPIAVPRR